MALRQLRTFDDEILRKKSRKVEKMDDKIIMLLEDMADTMYAAENGGGLSACQVGVLKRVVVIDIEDGLIELINPEIVHQAGEQIVEEGCLSFPDVWGMVKRPSKITVRALNREGKEIEIQAKGLLAQCISHEIDHLDGIVFTSKVIKYITD